MVLPNQLTVLRIILTPVFLFLFISDDPLLKQLSLVVFIIAAVTDWYDGWLARKFNYITNWGKFMDPLADKILTSTAFFAFVFLGVLQMWMVVVIVFRDFMVTGLRLYADTKGESMTTSYVAKWKTFIQMAFIYYLLAVFTLQTVGWIYNGNEDVFRMLTSPALINICMLIITALTIYTGVAYLFTNRKLLERFFSDEK
ncbi:MAG TPA: CDP-diacylglycerol--glycerol-3-phosphate 3-phosphatidyltransferase [Ignavibacteriales bacterium]|nr:CDP-diacylglycerol--glycerol-3-phosphate 3-phosphatidyltransferase [Ignavibacteriales bacterium]